MRTLDAIAGNSLRHFFYSPAFSILRVVEFRTRRQLAAFFILVCIVALFGFAAYRVVTTGATCEDRKQNQGEEGIDCGGPCVPCAIKQARPLKVFWARFVPTRDDRYDVVAEVTNSNTSVGAAAVEYEFRLLDGSGAVIVARRGNTFIYPRETVHLVEIGLEARERPARAVVDISSPRWVATAAIGPDVVAGNREYRVETSEDGSRSVVTAIVSNRSVGDRRDIGVAALLLDGRGNVVGAHRTVMDILEAGTSLPVRLVWSHVISEPVASILIEARSPGTFPRVAP
jgi:hypothetical protein